LHEQATLARNALAALTGQGNRPVVSGTPSLASARQIALPTELPADLLGQRADIVAARWRVEAAAHDVKSAKAQFYPNINLMAFAGLSSIGLGRLLDAGSQQWSVGPAIRLPIFDAGRLRANLRGKTADLDAAVESYNAAVLDAIHDVADQVASGQSIARQQAQQRDAQAAAEGAYQIALQRYRAGLGSYLNVLSAEGAVLNQRRLGVDLAARALDNQVALMRALGGGMRSNADTPATPAVASRSIQ
jgi:NodT family efflux transporter outer membrane factor (OMF) lipoprotein